MSARNGNPLRVPSASAGGANLKGGTRSIICIILGVSGQWGQYGMREGVRAREGGPGGPQDEGADRWTRSPAPYESLPPTEWGALGRDTTENATYCLPAK